MNSRTQLLYFLQLHVTYQSSAPAADPTVVIDADGGVDTKKALKSLSFPLMDDDGLPSSYLQRILGAIAKWRVKMHNIMSCLENLEEAPDTVDASLSLMVHCCLFTKCKHHDIKDVLLFMFGHHAAPITWFYLRLAKRAQQIDEALIKVEGKITAVNTKGILDGFTSELPGYFRLSRGKFFFSCRHSLLPPNLSSPGTKMS